MRRPAFITPAAFVAGSRLPRRMAPCRAAVSAPRRECRFLMSLAVICFVAGFFSSTLTIRLMRTATPADMRAAA